MQSYLHVPITIMTAPSLFRQLQWIFTAIHYAEISSVTPKEKCEREKWMRIGGLHTIWGSSKTSN